ncbi:hypothetical protein AB0D12_37365 [Streptomyces sp. NPDC048479]|uniref:hypothetical protein n=1 Tax=Streptomyces sp. NPDC048479 TaxID=3154725 RepID=UPI003448F2CA
MVTPSTGGDPVAHAARLPSERRWGAFAGRRAAAIVVLALAVPAGGLAAGILWMNREAPLDLGPPVVVTRPAAAEDQPPGAPNDQLSPLDPWASHTPDADNGAPAPQPQPPPCSDDDDDNHDDDDDDDDGS